MEIEDIEFGQPYYRKEWDFDCTIFIRKEGQKYIYLRMKKDGRLIAQSTTKREWNKKRNDTHYELYYHYLEEYKNKKRIIKLLFKGN